MTRTKLFIATPMYGGQCYGFYTGALLSLQQILMRHNIGAMLKYHDLPPYEYVYSSMYNESLIPRARNALTQAFLKSDCTHLFFWDADIKCEDPNAVIRMVAADKDIICGIYPKKEINWETVARAVRAGVPVDQLKHHTGAWVINLLGYADNVTVPANEPLEVYNGGTGFMLIKREVFEKLMPHTEKYVNDVRDQSGTIGAGEEIYEFFDLPIEKETRRLLSEDYAFCYNWRNIGGKVWAAPWVQLAHAGTYLYEGRLIGAPAVSAGPVEAPSSQDAPQSPNSPDPATTDTPTPATPIAAE